MKCKFEYNYTIYIQDFKLNTVLAVFNEMKDEVIEKIIQSKEKQLENLIGFGEDTLMKSCTSYLKNARPDLFSDIRNKLKDKTTSHAERVMRTINYRINAGHWSPAGALNLNKIHLAYYYNGFDGE